MFEERLPIVMLRLRFGNQRRQNFWELGKRPQPINRGGKT